MLRATVVIVFALLMASSCARTKTVKQVPQAPQRSVKTVKPGDTERGIASWYGEPYHGRHAANGEVYDMNSKTAAHRTMPFGTWLRVDNETNGKQVNVRVTDRGPFVGDRIIDLSHKAAQEIAMIGPGTARVKLTVIEPPRGEVVERYGVQVAAWEDKTRAETQKLAVQKNYKNVRVVESNETPRMYRVIVGEGTREQAQDLSQQLRKEGYRGFVTRHVP